MLIKHDFNQTIITLISRITMRRSQSNHKFRLSIQSDGIARHELARCLVCLVNLLKSDVWSCFFVSLC